MTGREPHAGTQDHLSFGYPEKPEALTWTKRAGGHEPLDEIVHWERWQARGRRDWPTS